jgi:hypothetical protein
VQSRGDDRLVAGHALVIEDAEVADERFKSWAESSCRDDRVWPQLGPVTELDAVGVDR